MSEFEKALKDPASAFSRPKAVLEAGGLSDDQKIRILRQWEYDVLQLTVATEENMPPADSSGPTRLEEIRQSLESLGEEHGPGPGGTKYG